MLYIFVLNLFQYNGANEPEAVAVSNVYKIKGWDKISIREYTASLPPLIL